MKIERQSEGGSECGEGGGGEDRWRDKQTDNMRDKEMKRERLGEEEKQRDGYQTDGKVKRC